MPLWVLIPLIAIVDVLLVLGVAQFLSINSRDELRDR